MKVHIRIRHTSIFSQAILLYLVAPPYVVHGRARTRFFFLLFTLSLPIPLPFTNFHILLSFILNFY